MSVASGEGEQANGTWQVNVQDKRDDGRDGIPSPKARMHPRCFAESWRLALDVAESKRYPTYLSWKTSSGGNLWSLNTDGCDVSNLFYIFLISRAVWAMRCLFVLPVQRCGAFVSSQKVALTPPALDSLGLNVNVFGDLFTCKLCVPGRLLLTLWLSPPATCRPCTSTVLPTVTRTCGLSRSARGHGSVVAEESATAM